MRAARSYTLEEAGTALGVSQGTIRNWVKKGLRIMNAQRPYLILGEDLKEFRQTQLVKRKAALQPTQLYCLSCKAPRTPMGMLVDCIPQTATTARLMGLCEACGGTCNRMISRAKIDHYREIFALAEKGGKTA
ncbi:helix-turn-helix domain-containing protein [Frigidibacter sp. RF13]|uniref:helix-turn-helix domain-containing protein n=1 Tax=Frigidibacter sp. RF13 TaxID=2997340 RepID=UPI00226DEEC4|nr:helix-turn-helix domain-containing protein [Frigidibacter sp. RF13]MCY1128022.1 helix-turn-helix domain-containing protein [Frigidibacter sp. RF13]